MDTKKEIQEQNENLKEMNYKSEEDIYAQDKHLPVDNNGEPSTEEELTEEENDDLDMGLDVPGAKQDDKMQEIGEEDEENNYWSLSDNADEDA